MTVADSVAWTKPADAIIESHRRMLKRISAAVHSFATQTGHVCRNRRLSRHAGGPRPVVVADEA